MALPRDESQQIAELRQAFLKHLPRRIESLRRKVQRLTRGAWDVNALTLLVGEVQGLCGSSGRYGLVGTSESLYKLELLLSTLLTGMAMPDEELRSRIEQLAAQIGEQPDAPVTRIAAIGDIRQALPPPAPFPVALVLPADAWKRFDTIEVGMLDAGSGCLSTDPPALPAATTPPEESLAIQLGGGLELSLDIGLTPAPTSVPVIAEGPGFELEGLSLDDPRPTPAPPPVLTLAPVPETAPPVAAPAGVEARTRSEAQSVAGGLRRLHYLAASAAFSHELESRLKAMPALVERSTHVEQALSVLASTTPDAVLVDSRFQSRLQEIGDEVARLRNLTGRKLPLIAFGSQDDLSAKVKAMRAGVDLMLPLNLPAQEAAAKIQEQLDLDQGGGFRVMIVEDDRSQALFAESVLRKAGFETLAVTEPLSTLRRLESFKPDLILMDLYMPDVSGMELTAIIREREEFISTPIVFLSGEQDPEKHFEALSAGGDDFLSKPIRPKHLISAVTNRSRRARLSQSRQKAGDARDSQSGLHDRAHVIDRLAHRQSEEEASPASLLFLEVDELPALRAEHGLAALEGMLVEIGSQLALNLREGECAARYGDGSHIALLDREASAALEMARALRAQVQASRYRVGSQAIACTISIGACALSPQLIDPGSLIGAAEKAMLRARSTRGDRIALYEPEGVTAGQSEGDQIATALAEALKHDGLQLLFQPIVALNGTGDEHYEVMIRLKLPGGAVIPSATVLEVARERSLLSDLDRWLLGRSLAILDERRRSGRMTQLYVRQSAATFDDHERIEWLGQQLQMRGLKADRLTLEFHLFDIQRALKQALGILPRYRQLGIKLAMDEFQSNLTAMQLISVLPVDYIKLAPKYCTPPTMQQLSAELRALIAAAHDSKRLVVAPMVEHAQVAATLWTAGVDLIQGNFVQQPGPDLGFDFSQSVL